MSFFWPSPICFEQNKTIFLQKADQIANIKKKANQNGNNLVLFRIIILVLFSVILLDSGSREKRADQVMDQCILLN
jgi:hypothetical protein